MGKIRHVGSCHELLEFIFNKEEVALHIIAKYDEGIKFYCNYNGR